MEQREKDNKSRNDKSCFFYVLSRSNEISFTPVKILDIKEQKRENTIVPDKMDKFKLLVQYCPETIFKSKFKGSSYRFKQAIRSIANSNHYLEKQWVSGSLEGLDSQTVYSLLEDYRNDLEKLSKRKGEISFRSK